MNNNNKRAQICGFDFFPISTVNIEYLPGIPNVKLGGESYRIDISSCEFNEDDQEDMSVAQQLSATVTDTSHNNIGKLRSTFLEPGIIVLTYTNGEKKVVGSGEFPVFVSFSISGSPATINLNFERDSPEAAKIFQSF